MENELLIGIFGSSHSDPPAPALEFSGLDKVIAELDEKKEHTWKGEGIVKKVAQTDFLKDFLGDVPAPAPASLPSAGGVIPDKRPNTGTAARTPKPSARRGKVEQIVQEFLEALGEPGVTNYTREAVQSLIEAVESYVEQSVKTVRSELKKLRN